MTTQLNESVEKAQKQSYFASTTQRLALLLLCYRLNTGSNRPTNDHELNETDHKYSNQTIWRNCLPIPGRVRRGQASCCTSRNPRDSSAGIIPYCGIAICRIYRCRTFRTNVAASNGQLNTFYSVGATNCY